MAQLPRLPHRDTNGTQDAADSDFLHEELARAELHTRVLCEGNVNGIASEQYASQTGIEILMDYTW